MKISPDTVTVLTDFFENEGLLPRNATSNLIEMSTERFAFKEQLEMADSIHLHIKVADTGGLPHEAIIKQGGRPENAKEGYVKYSFAGGYNFIFSSIPVSQEEKSGIGSFEYPHLDHIGIDIRSEQ